MLDGLLWMGGGWTVDEAVFVKDVKFPCLTDFLWDGGNDALDLCVGIKSVFSKLSS